MGIQGFLPLLKSIMVPVHIKDLKGCSVAVDTYSWLHKGALSCSTELCKGMPTTRHIEYCMHRVNLLRHFGVKPILVFDGGLLPMKSEQENKRARARKDNLARAVEHESDGNSAAAYECYQKAVDISPQIACELIQVLKQENLQYIVAPYEADAQMTFLAISGQVDAVITEDSDLIPFGCPRIIFKMDKFGQGVQFQYSMLQKNKELSFEGFNRQMLLEMCILSGCDYLQSLPGMGLKRAHASIKKFRSYDKVLKHLRYSGVSVPPFYEESFKKAIFTFQYQRVYDPINENIVHLSNIPDDIGDELDFLGPYPSFLIYTLTWDTPMPKDIAQRIAKGDLDPITKMPFEGENLTARLAIAGTSQFKTHHSESAKKKIDLPVQKNLLTKYFSMKGFASLEAKRKFRAPRVSPSAANETKNSTASVIDSEDWGSVPPPNSHVEYGSATNISEFTESPCHMSMVGEEKKSPEHTVLRQPRQPIHKPCLGLHKDHEHTNVEDTVEGKTREATQKVIVRSAYFQHKQVEKNVYDEKQDCLSSGVVIDKRKNALSDSDFCNNDFKNKDQENLQPRQMHRSSPPHNNGCCDHNVDGPFTENNAEEENFGTKISHLGQYSEIAEKSMERFVSVMSSFRCTSGTRVSGLRAPLKDVRNTSGNRPKKTVDFGQYAYVPKQTKTRRIAPGN
ncbi:Exonuclease 1 [Glycine max]|nr:Exonuclease 1 [Glycine max]